MAYKRLDILKLLAQEEIPFCQCCGERRYWALSIDHIKGGGVQHRLKVANTTTWVLIARELREGRTVAQLLEDYRVLCHNCNYGAKTNEGRCPHQDEKETNE